MQQTYPPFGHSVNLARTIPTVLRFKETASYERGFEVYFEEKVKPMLKELDRQRQESLDKREKSRPKANLIFLGALALGIGITILSENLTGLLFFGVVGYLVKWAILNGPGSQLARDYKAKIVPLVINFFGDYQYEQKRDTQEDEKLFRTLQFLSSASLTLPLSN